MPEQASTAGAAPVTATTARGNGYAGEIAYALFKHKRLIAAMVVLTAAGIGLGAALRPRTYEAAALLVIKHDRGELLVTPNLGVNGTQRANPDQDLLSEAELLKRHSLLAEVVRTLGHDAAMAGYVPRGVKVVRVGTAAAGGPAGVAREDEEEAESEGDEDEEEESALGGRALELIRRVMEGVQRVEAWPYRVVEWLNPTEPMGARDRAVQRLSRGLEAYPVVGSSVIRVTYTAEEPRFAETVLNLLIANYLDQYARVRSSPGAVGFFDHQVTKLRDELHGAEDELQRFDVREGIAALEPQRDAFIRAALERETALDLTRSEVQELGEKVRLLRAKLGEMPERVRTAEEVRSNPVVTAMRGRLLDLELERNKLLQKYMPQDRLVRDVEREITLLRQRFESEAASELAQETFQENPVRQPVVVEIVNTEAQLTRSEVKARNLAREVVEQRARLRHLGNAAYERDRLERRRKTLEEAYLLYTKKRDEARISHAMDQSQIVNIAVVEPVRVAPQSGSRAGRAVGLSLLGAVVGLVLGSGGALAREYLNPALTTEDSVQRHLGVPVLVTIPDRRG